MFADVEVTETIREIHAATRGTYGVPWVTRAAIGLGQPVDRKGIALVMERTGNY